MTFQQQIADLARSIQCPARPPALRLTIPKQARLDKEERIIAMLLANPDIGVSALAKLLNRPNIDNLCADLRQLWSAGRIKRRSFKPPHKQPHWIYWVEKTL